MIQELQDTRYKINVTYYVPCIISDGILIRVGDSMSKKEARQYLKRYFRKEVSQGLAVIKPFYAAYDW